MLNGLIKPDTGKIAMRGQVGALIALGAGFNPILTGRENIYINASILGLSEAQVASMLDEIIDFSEIGDFIDTPVQSYSSGMQVRLGFGVASCLNPDILVIDEALAVGDIEFRSKCYNKIKEISKSTAIILVSHNKQDLQRACSTGLVMRLGKSIFYGGLLDSLAEYEHASYLDKGITKIQKKEFVADGIHVRLMPVTPLTITTGKSIEFKFEARSDRVCKDVHLRATFMSSAGECVAEYRSEYHEKPINLTELFCEHKLVTPGLQLSAGSYSINIVLYNKETEYLSLHDNAGIIRVASTQVSLAPYII
jgi:lipopolysaccharide transport system ATP-binding protein